MEFLPGITVDNMNNKKENINNFLSLNNSFFEYTNLNQISLYLNIFPVFKNEKERFNTFSKKHFHSVENLLLDNINIFPFNRSRFSMTFTEQVMQDFYREEKSGLNNIQLKAIQTTQEVL